MRTTISTLLLGVLVVAGCSDGSAGETTTSFEAIPGVPDRPAMEVVEEMLTAMNAADSSAVFGYHHPKAVVTLFEGDAFSLDDTSEAPIEDFDGDGVATSADIIQWNFAMRKAWGRQSTWDCREVDQAVVECTITSTNDVVGTGPGLDWIEVQSFRVERGLIVEVRGMNDPEINALADTQMVRELFAYERWVEQTYPEKWAQLFDEPCCNLEFRELPANIAIHQNLMAEFLAGR